jgi:hypothetical protein
MDSGHHLGSASPGQQKRTTSRALPTRVADFNLLCVDASVQLYPGLAQLTIRPKTALFNRLLVRRSLVARGEGLGEQEVHLTAQLFEQCVSAFLLLGRASFGDLMNRNGDVVQCSA